jgi:hypothetical protein
MNKNEFGRAHRKDTLRWILRKFLLYFPSFISFSMDFRILNRFSIIFNLENEMEKWETVLGRFSVQGLGGAAWPSHRSDPWRRRGKVFTSSLSVEWGDVGQGEGGESSSICLVTGEGQRCGSTTAFGHRGDEGGGGVHDQPGPWRMGRWLTENGVSGGVSP